MKSILVTGATGFIGRHLMEALDREKNIKVLSYNNCCPNSALEAGLAEADFIFHLAGVNRPQNVEEYQNGNAVFTSRICTQLRQMERNPVIVFSSSVQASLDNPYGRSKLAAEEELRKYCEETGGCAILFRLPNVFGKWCRPNYNSVVATFCHNIAHDLPINISDPAREIELVYIDDVILAFLNALNSFREVEGCHYSRVLKTFHVNLGNLSTTVQGFRESRKTLLLPSFADEFTRYLYATFISYLDVSDFDYSLHVKTDERGCLAEFMKSAQFGQVFVSRTKPGVTRGNHYHHTKTEKFLVVEGEAMVRLRQISTDLVLTYHIFGTDLRVVDIPPGYAHSIENVGATELVVLFWACETFDPTRPDTIPLKVKDDNI